MADQFQWGGVAWGAGQLDEFTAYLKAHGTSYASWAANHPAAAAILTSGPAAAPTDENVPKSVGEAIAAAETQGATPAEAAASAAALAAAQAQQGMGSPTGAQLTAAADQVEQALQANPPPGSDLTGTQSADSSLQSGGSLGPFTVLDPHARQLADASGVPPLPPGLVTLTADGAHVTQMLVVMAALTENTDYNLLLALVQHESGFNVETGDNGYGAVGPAQVEGFPVWDKSSTLEDWCWSNLIAGARIMRALLSQFGGSIPKVAAAYNAGAGPVASDWPGVLSWLEIKGHPEDGTVQDYVNAVQTNLAAWKKLTAGGPAFNKDGSLGGPISANPAATQEQQAGVPGDTADAWSLVVHSLHNLRGSTAVTVAAQIKRLHGLVT